MTSAFRDKPRQILNVFHRFGNHCSCHLQGECLIGGFRKPYIVQAVGGEWDVKNKNYLISSNIIKWPKNEFKGVVIRAADSVVGF
jgi:hypothetical protein